ANRSLVANLALIPCSYSLSSSGASIGASGATGSLNVTAGSGCAWSAVVNDSWISLPSGNNGSGSGILNYSVAANTSTSPRTGSITIAGQPFTVSQAAAVTTYTISVTSSPT